MNNNILEASATEFRELRKYFNYKYEKKMNINY